MGTCTCEGRFINRGAKLRVRGCILPREFRRVSRWIYGLLRPSVQGRYLSKSIEPSCELGCGLKTLIIFRKVLKMKRFTAYGSFILRYVY